MNKENANMELFKKELKSILKRNQMVILEQETTKYEVTFMISYICTDTT